MRRVPPPVARAALQRDDAPHLQRQRIVDQRDGMLGEYASVSRRCVRRVRPERRTDEVLVRHAAILRRDRTLEERGCGVQRSDVHLPRGRLRCVHAEREPDSVLERRHAAVLQSDRGLGEQDGMLGKHAGVHERQLRRLHAEPDSFSLQRGRGAAVLRRDRSLEGRVSVPQPNAGLLGGDLLVHRGGAVRGLLPQRRSGELRVLRT